MPPAYTQPVLVSSVDGVGSKLKIAFMTGRHDTIGIDLVAMSVNDILVQGARPLFFLDYLAMADVEPETAEAILKGIVRGCVEAQCSLIGGETAELPDFYAPGDYDLAGFVVGVVDRDKIIDGSEVSMGDKIIGLGSSGLHSNGYTLVRRIIFDDLGLDVAAPFHDRTIGEELLTPTRIYVNIIHLLLRDFQIRGMAHITGGGLLENLPRVLPNECQAVIEKQAWPQPDIFPFLQKSSDIEELEMYRTFNMGVGMVLVVSSEIASEILERLTAMREPAWLIGEVRERPIGADPVILV